MNTITNPNVFGTSKTDALKNGMIIRQRFLHQINRVTKFKNNESFSHSYIYSPPGIGKTFSIKQHLMESDTRFIQVTGNVSMFAFGIQLATINFLNQNKEKIVVFVDDCDILFANETNCNTMKNLLSGAKSFSYEKSLQSQWSNLSETQKMALKSHQNEEKMGFEVPTDDMIFIFASNFRLPIDDEIKSKLGKNTSRSILMSHQNAIRSRCNVGDFNLSNVELWGWVADVVLNTSCLNKYFTSNEQKLEILDFLWRNWMNLTERSIRLVEKMALIINEYPDNYNSVWKIDFTIKN